MADKWNEEAKRLLPCNCVPAPAMSQFDNGHTLNCAVFNRPAVAAALAAAEVQGLEMAIGIIRKQIAKGWDGSAIMLNRAIESEIDKRKGKRM